MRRFGELTEDRPQSRLFEAITRELLRSGNAIRFQARGASMSPAIRDGEIVHVKSVATAELRKGEIVLVKGEMGFRLHRLVVADAEQDVFITRGDCGQQDDPAVSREEIVGLAVAKEVRMGRRTVRAKLNGFGGRLLCGAARGQRVLLKRLSASTGFVESTAERWPSISDHSRAAAGFRRHCGECAGCRRFDQFWFRDAGRRRHFRPHRGPHYGWRESSDARRRFHQHHEFAYHGCGGRDVEWRAAELRRSAQRRGEHATRGNVVSACARHGNLQRQWSP